jgi:hypothetical protein
MAFVLFDQVFQVMKEQEETRLKELAAEKSHFDANQAQLVIVSDSPFVSHFSLIDIANSF